ncbi:MAG: hypothetical protein EOO61_08910 [Hymenobacter sp.]|nr:MAG: hypothetical protein EOO61_08910 [Hymenobacter sp.]
MRTGEKFTRTSRFNKIYVLDAPAQPGESKSAAELYTWLKNRAKQAGVLAERITVTSKKNLVKRLHELGDEAEQGRIVPLLHFEAHGKMTGMVIRLGELIEWSSLLNLTRRINVATRNNLLLSFAVCSAGFLYPEIDIMKPAPFHGFVSSIHDLHFGAMEAGYNAFFDTMLSTNSMNKALEALNADYAEQHTGHLVEEQIFEFKLAELFFENIWSSYREDWDSEEKRKSRITDQMLLAFKDPVLRNKYSIPTMRYLFEKLNTEENMQEVKLELRRVFMME